MNTTNPLDVLTEVFETSVELERGRIRFFAEVLGEDDPVYRDVASAREAGHPDLPVPPTMMAGLELGTGHVYRVFEALGVDVRLALHAEQWFGYHDLAHAGEVAVLRTSVGETWERRAGALLFVPRHTEVWCGDRHVATMRATEAIQRDRRGAAS